MNFETTVPNGGIEELDSKLGERLSRMSRFAMGRRDQELYDEVQGLLRDWLAITDEAEPGYENKIIEIHNKTVEIKNKITLKKIANSSAYGKTVTE